MHQRFSDEQIITKIEQQQRHSHRYNIYINEEYAFSVHEDIVVKFRLLKDHVITELIQQEILNQEEQHSAFRFALRYIGKAMRSESEIADKLRSKGYHSNIISSVLQILKQQQLINDGEYAAALSRQRLRTNKKGSLWIKRELIQKGISNHHIQSALKQIDENSEYEHALNLASRRWSQIAEDESTKLRKLAGMLQRRGFTIEVTKKVLTKLRASNEESFGMD